MKCKQCEECFNNMHVDHPSFIFDKKYFCSFGCLSDWVFNNSTHYVLQESDLDFLCEDDAE